MIIRKLFRFESAHTVRNCTSRRCSESFHGHSGVVECFFKASSLTNGGMILDFGDMKKTIGSFIDAFDHSIHLWNKDAADVREFFKTHNKRWIELPCNPTAENYSLLFRDCINDIIKMTDFKNNEGDDIRCVGVRYHETVTGYSQSEEDDPKLFSLSDIVFSEQTLNEMSEEIKKILKGERVANELPNITVK